MENAKNKSTNGVTVCFPNSTTKGMFWNLFQYEPKKGNWDNRPDDNQLKKFDVVLANPPFGEDRSFVPKDNKDSE
jgi:type I restriction enzyme M protein